MARFSVRFFSVHSFPLTARFALAKCLKCYFSFQLAATADTFALFVNFTQTAARFHGLLFCIKSYLPSLMAACITATKSRKSLNSATL